MVDQFGQVLRDPSDYLRAQWCPTCDGMIHPFNWSHKSRIRWRCPSCHLVFYDEEHLTIEIVDVATWNEYLAAQVAHPKIKREEFHKLMAENRALVVETKEMYALDGPFAEMRDMADSLDPDGDQTVWLGEQLEALEDTEMTHYLANVIRWIKNNQQAIAAQKALAQPHLEQAQVHLDRAKSMETTNELLRDKLARAVAVMPNRKFDDGEHKVHVQQKSRVVFVGTCKAHSGVHFENDDCLEHEPSRLHVPDEYLKIKIEPRKAAAARLLAEIKTEQDEASKLPVPTEPTPAPEWCKRVDGKLSAVIR